MAMVAFLGSSSRFIDTHVMWRQVYSREESTHCRHTTSCMKERRQHSYNITNETLGTELDLGGIDVSNQVTTTKTRSTTTTTTITTTVVIRIIRRLMICRRAVSGNY